MAATWTALMITVAPIIYKIIHLPIACDIFAVCILMLMAYVAQEPGAMSLTGLVTTLLVVALRGVIDGLFFLGFLAMGVFVDMVFVMAGFDRLTTTSSRRLDLFIGALFVMGTALAGLIIAIIMLSFTPAPMAYGLGALFIPFWTGLHTAGGLIGIFIGLALIKSLKRQQLL